MTTAWCWEFGSSLLLKKGKTNNIVTVKLEKNSDLINIGPCLIDQVRSFRSNIPRLVLFFEQIIKYLIAKL